MPKKQERYEVRINDELHDAFKTRRAASMVAVSLRVEGKDVEIIDTQPPKKKPKKVEGEGFIMEQEVVDPHETHKTTKVQRAPSRNLIEKMHRAGRITLQQYTAAERYYHAYIVNSGQTNGSIDYAKPLVDTFGNGESIQISELSAKQDLQEANKVLGKLEIYRLQSILIHNSTLRRYCLSVYKADDKRRQQKESDALKKSLTTLAVLWGYENASRSNRGISQNVA